MNLMWAQMKDKVTSELTTERTHSVLLRPEHCCVTTSVGAVVNSAMLSEYYMQTLPTLAVTLGTGRAQTYAVLAKQG